MNARPLVIATTHPRGRVEVRPARPDPRDPNAADALVIAGHRLAFAGRYSARAHTISARWDQIVLQVAPGATAAGALLALCGHARVSLDGVLLAV